MTGKDMQDSTSHLCGEYKLLMMKALDGEISPEEERELHAHLRGCSECRGEFQQFQQLKEQTMEIKKQVLPEAAWEDYWRRLYNRLERGLVWILISIGAVILLGYAAYQFVIETLSAADLPGIVKFGILALVIGLAILLVSVIREKLLLRKHDKYKEIQR